MQRLLEATELTEVALAATARDELPVLNETAAEYFADPGALLRRRSADDPLGAGIDVEMLTPYLLWASSFVMPVLIGFAGEIAKSVGVDLLKEPLVGWVRRMFRRAELPPRRPGSPHRAAGGSPAEGHRRPVLRRGPTVPTGGADRGRDRRCPARAAVTETPVVPLPRPSSTSLRMVLVSVALVVSGLFVGTGLYNAIDDSWTARIVGCVAADPLDLDAQLACQAPAERERVVAAVGAALALVVLAAVVVLVMPTVLRRVRRLAPADLRYAPALQEVAGFAAADGVRTPGILIGPPATVSAPFCLGRPGNYRIALPRKLALTSKSPLFQALVRHELAHIAQHDVALSWLARSLWYVLAALLALPVVVTAVYDGDPLFALDILWRSAALIVVVLVVIRALLRAREFDADLRAARVVGVRGVLDAALSHHPAQPAGWRAWRRWHPSAERRRAVLADPADVRRAHMDRRADGRLPRRTRAPDRHRHRLRGAAGAQGGGLGGGGRNAGRGTAGRSHARYRAGEQALVAPTTAHRGTTAPVALVCCSARPSARWGA